jgi:hypothetical protein
MRQRNSTTVVDSDVNDAFRELTRPSTTSRWHKCVGDALLIIGGALLFSFWSSSHWITLMGIAVCGAGFYLREFTTDAW